MFCRQSFDKNIRIWLYIKSVSRPWKSTNTGMNNSYFPNKLHQMQKNLFQNAIHLLYLLILPIHTLCVRMSFIDSQLLSSLLAKRIITIRYFACKILFVSVLKFCFWRMRLQLYRRDCASNFATRQNKKFQKLSK